LNGRCTLILFITVTCIRVLAIEADEIIWKQKKPILGKEASILLMRIGAIRFGEFKLTSGTESPYYIDLRLAPSYPDVLDRIGDLYVEVIKNEIQSKWKIDRIAGIPTAGVPIATVVSQKLRIPLIYVRREQKGHGLGKRIEGVVEAKDNILLVDDLVTTGKSTIQDAAILRERGNMKHVVVLVDREQGGARNLQRGGLELHPLVKITDVFGYLSELGAIPRNTYEDVMKYVKASPRSK
jgi:orotate phosphoribosyltransferase